MLEILDYQFMRRALLSGSMLAIMIPLIGVVMINRKTSMVGDALSHVSLAGVALGLILGIDPVLGAILVCIIAAFSIEAIRHRLPQYGDMAVAIIVSIGLGFAAVLASFTPGSHNFESYIFGSITSITQWDLLQITLTFIAVVVSSILLYGALLDIAIDENLARLSGVRVQVVNSVFTFLSAITIALAVKIVGALLVASLIVLPVSTALILAKSYRQMFIIAILLGLIYMLSGIIISFYYDVNPGGAIVLTALIGMALSAIFKKFLLT